jgi:hypothetical protein
MSRRENVWYRQRPKARRFGPIRAWDDVGVLVIEPGRIEFLGRKQSFVVESPRVVSVELRGADTINPWVEVVGVDGERGFFADGRRLGWAGVRGGTAALAEAIESCQNRGAPEARR